MIARGRMTTPGAIVANFGKNWRTAIARKNLRGKVYQKRHNRRNIVRIGVHVSDPSKLFQQIPGYKGDNGVLGRDNLI